MAPGSPSAARSAAVPPDGARPRSAWPGLTESAPLLVFGSVAVALGIYLVVTHTAALGGRLPLWAYLCSLGSIAVVGSLVASRVGDDFDDLPGEGEAVGTDLIVVRRSEWESLRLPPVAVRPTPVPSPSPEGRPPEPVGRSDWWVHALAQPPELRPPPAAPPAAASSSATVDEVIAALDSLPAVIAPPVPAPKSRPPARAPSRPTPPPPRVPTPSPGPAAPSVDSQIDEIDRGMADILARPGTPAPPRWQEEEGCVGCHRTLDARERTVNCDSCNRPMCPACDGRSRSSAHPGLCPTCGMLLDGALGGPA